MVKYVMEVETDTALSFHSMPVVICVLFLFLFPTRLRKNKDNSDVSGHGVDRYGVCTEQGRDVKRPGMKNLFVTGIRQR